MIQAQTINIQSVALALLVPSATEAQAQRRKHFDKEGLQQLAASMKDAGVLNPIVVRPAGENFEIVAGERRFQAAKLAGLDEVPVSVRDLTDAQVLEVQLIENLQREGLHELHEAEGYEALRKLGHTTEQIAEKVARSREYVYARMKLLALGKEARAAFYDGKLVASTALLIARIPNEKLQKEALKAITEGRWGGGPMSVRDAADYIQKEFMLRLEDAEFDTASETLVKGATACGRCPKNTVSQPGLFGDVKAASAGVCTDPSCFRAKVAAHGRLAVALAKEKGQKVIEGAEAKKALDHRQEEPAYGSNFVMPSAKNYADPKERTYKQLAGPDAKTTLIVAPETGKVIEVLTKADVAAGMKKQGIQIKADAPKKSPQPSAADKKAAEKHALEVAVRVEIGKQLMDKAPKPLHRDELVLIAERLGQDYYNSDDPVYDVLGDLDDARRDKMTEPQLLKFIRAHLYADAFDMLAKAEGLFAAAKRAGIKVDVVRKKVTASTKAKQSEG